MLNRADLLSTPIEHIEFQAHGRGYFGPFAQEPATSWATPHLAAIAARILSLQPDLKPAELRELLELVNKLDTRNRAKKDRGT